MQGTRANVPWFAYLDRSVRLAPHFESERSFVGGTPVLAPKHEKKPFSPSCAVCEQPMSLVAQVAATRIEGRRRALLLMCCLRCSQSPGQWKAFRTQCEFEGPRETSSDDEDEDDETSDQNFKSQTASQTTQQPMFVFGANKSSDNSNNNIVDADDPFVALIAARDGGGASTDAPKKQPIKKKKQPKPARRGWGASDIQPCMLDVVEGWSEKEKTGKNNAKGGKSKADKEEERRLRAFYGVDEDGEYDDNRSNDDGKRSKKKQGNKKGGGESWAGETAEDSTPTSKTFQRFMKIQSSDPERVIMVEHGGRPCWISDPAPFTGAPPKCRNCGASCVFELQLLPSIIYLGTEKGLWKERDLASIAGVLPDAAALEREDEGVLVSEDVEITDEQQNDGQSFGGAQRDVLALLNQLSFSPLPEFGVVAVYSCANSCDSEEPVEEHVFCQYPV